MRVLDWWHAYRPQHYRLVGIADIMAGTHTEYRWGTAAEAYRPQSPHFLAVYLRSEMVRPDP